MVDQAFKVDLSKPLVFQVGHLGEAYDAWVHKPIVSKDTPRFFENDLMEFFTRTPWWVIPLVWFPVASWFISSSVKAGLPLSHVEAAVVGGIFLWTFIEYTLHRFLFHMKTTTYWANTLHYLLHGCHHKHPMDSLRLVFPPAAAAILSVPVCKKSSMTLQTLQRESESLLSKSCVSQLCLTAFEKKCFWKLFVEFENTPLRTLLSLVFTLSMTLLPSLLYQLCSVIKLLAPAPYSPALTGGLFLGYLMYDCTHYYLHYGKPLQGLTHELKRNHMEHHFRIQDKGFGITSTLWDRVFGTLFPRSTKKSS